MKIKALKNFVGTISMSTGQVIDYGNKVVVNDLVKAGYVEIVKENEEAKKSEQKDADAESAEKKGEAKSEQKSAGAESAEEKKKSETKRSGRKSSSKVPKN